MNTFQRVTTGAVFGLIALVGVGCQKGGDVINNITDSASGKMSELDYYNLVIEHANNLSENIEDYSSSLDTYDTFAYSREEKTCDYKKPAAFTIEQEFTDAKTALGDDVKMESEENQAKVKEKLTPYFDSYQKLMDAGTAFTDYCEHEKYKDDDGAQIEPLYNGVSAAIDDASTKQSELFAVVKELQKGVDLGIDENTDKPNEVAILIQNDLTDKVEVSYKDAFTPYAEKVLAGEEADFAPVQQSYDDLMADLAAQREKGASVGLPEDTMLGAAYTNYMDSIDKYNTELEKLSRDQKNGEVNAENITTYDDSIVSAYDGVITSHNSLVDSLESYVQY